MCQNDRWPPDFSVRVEKKKKKTASDGKYSIDVTSDKNIHRAIKGLAPRELSSCATIFKGSLPDSALNMKLLLTVWKTFGWKAKSMLGLTGELVEFNE